MARRRYIVWNGATAALTGALSGVSTGTSLKTMLQVKPGSPISIIEWGYYFDVVPSAVVRAELIVTGTVAATVTTFAAGDVAKYDNSANGDSLLTLGTSASGFTASAEGSITATRLLDSSYSWAQQYSKQFPLDREPGVVKDDILRVRMHTATAITATCYVVFEE